RVQFFASGPGIVDFQVAAADPRPRDPAPRIALLPRRQLLEDLDRLLHGLTALENVGIRGVSLRLLQQVDALLELGLQPGLLQRLPRFGLRVLGELSVELLDRGL